MEANLLSFRGFLRRPNLQCKESSRFTDFSCQKGHLSLYIIYLTERSGHHWLFKFFIADIYSARNAGTTELGASTILKSSTTVWKNPIGTFWLQVDSGHMAVQNGKRSTRRALHIRCDRTTHKPKRMLDTLRCPENVRSSVSGVTAQNTYVHIIGVYLWTGASSIIVPKWHWLHFCSIDLGVNRHTGITIHHWHSGWWGPCGESTVTSLVPPAPVPGTRSLTAHELLTAQLQAFTLLPYCLRWIHRNKSSTPTGIPVLA